MADEIGRWLPAGMAAGFKKDMPAAMAVMKKSLNSAIDDLKADVAMTTDGILGDVNVTGSSTEQAAAGQQVVNFYQTNNSPKALDRLTIYRETNSLLFNAKVRMGNA